MAKKAAVGSVDTHFSMTNTGNKERELDFYPIGDSDVLQNFVLDYLSFRDGGFSDFAI